MIVIFNVKCHFLLIFKQIRNPSIAFSFPFQPRSHLLKKVKDIGPSGLLINKDLESKAPPFHPIRKFLTI